MEIVSQWDLNHFMADARWHNAWGEFRPDLKCTGNEQALDDDGKISNFNMCFFGSRPLYVVQYVWYCMLTWQINSLSFNGLGLGSRLRVDFLVACLADAIATLTVSP